jgi:hypothetical protein
MTINGVIPVGMEPPPLHPPEVARPSTPERAKAKGKSATLDRFHVINTFVDATMAGLTPAERSVWLVLWRDTKPNGLAKASQASIARRAGISDRSVRTALQSLKRQGLVRVVRQGSLHRGPSSYQVLPLSVNASTAEPPLR